MAKEFSLVVDNPTLSTMVEYYLNEVYLKSAVSVLKVDTEKRFDAETFTITYCPKEE